MSKAGNLAAWLALGVSGALAVWFGFAWSEPEQLGLILLRTGYWFTLGAVALFMVALGGLARHWGPRIWAHRRVVAGGLAAAAFLTLAMCALRPSLFKIIYDEPLLASTAQVMHDSGKFGYASKAFWVEGEFAILGVQIDKRPPLYPFLVSLAHDVTGYRLANSFLVNQCLAAASLFFVFLIGWRTTGGWRGGAIAAGAWGSLPLLYALATGGGLDLLAATISLGLVLLGAVVLGDDRGRGQLALWIGFALLLQARYEGAIAVVSAGLFAFILFVRQRRSLSPWAWIVPPLCLPVAWLQRVIQANQDLFTRNGQSVEAPFGWGYLAENLGAAFQYLFDFTFGQNSSPLLTLAGVASLAALAYWRLRGTWRPQKAIEWSILCVSVWGVLQTLVFLFYFWADWTSYETARFSLGLQWVLVLAAAVFAGAAPRSTRRDNVVLALIALFLAAYTAPANWLRPAEREYPAWRHFAFRNQVLSELGEAPVVVLDYAVTCPILLERPAVDLSRWRSYREPLSRMVEDPALGVIAIFDQVRESDDGVWRTPSPFALPAEWPQRLIASEELAAGRFRVVAIAVSGIEGGADE